MHNESMPLAPSPRWFIREDGRAPRGCMGAAAHRVHQHPAIKEALADDPLASMPVDRAQRLRLVSPHRLLGDQRQVAAGAGLAAFWALQHVVALFAPHRHEPVAPVPCPAHQGDIVPGVVRCARPAKVQQAPRALVQRGLIGVDAAHGVAVVAAPRRHHSARLGELVWRRELRAALAQHRRQLRQRRRELGAQLGATQHVEMLVCTQGSLLSIPPKCLLYSKPRFFYCGIFPYDWSLITILELPGFYSVRSGSRASSCSKQQWVGTAFS